MTDDSSALADATASFLETYDGGERALEAVLEVDGEAETWTFDDVALDSGTFGELVSRGIVEKKAGEYRVADHDVVSAVHAGESVDSDSDDEGVFAFDFRLGSQRWGGRRALAGLLGALAALVLMRLTQVRSVFQDGRVVSPENDPYYYRYWTEELLEHSSSPAGFELLVNLPEGAQSRPLTHATNWWLATLLGGDQWAAEMVAAWLPIVATVVLGVCVYATAVLLTDDVRVGLAAVVLLAVTPVHAVYTGVGFLEHRLHQYLWLGVTLLALTWLAVDLKRAVAGEGGGVQAHLRNPTTWVAAGGLGVAVGFSTHIWAGSPLILLALAMYIGFRAVDDARVGFSPVLGLLPIIVAVGIGGVFAGGAHVVGDWHDAVIAFTPMVLFVGAVTVAALGECWRRYDLPPAGLLGLQGIGAVIGALVFRSVRPETFARLQSRADDLLLREGYTESISLFAVDYAIIAGPLMQLGVGFYLAVIVLGWIWVVSYRRYEPAWLLFAVYTTYFIALAALQVRFAAQLAIPLSVLAGIGFVHLLSTVDLARRPTIWESDDPQGRRGTQSTRRLTSVRLPERRRLAYVLGIGLLVCSFSLLYAPIFSGQVSHDESQLEAAQEIEAHADEHDREWRDNAVFSTMGENRMYNYFVSGESEQYRYVDSWYGDYVSEDDPDEWVDDFDDRFGYVIADESQGLSPDQLGANGERSLEHYQLLSLNEEEDLGAFVLVEGATITASGEAEERVTLESEVDAAGESFTYEREVAVDENGDIEATVPYAGEYSIDDETVEVSEADVLEGETVDA